MHVRGTLRERECAVSRRAAWEVVLGRFQTWLLGSRYGIVLIDVGNGMFGRLRDMKA